MSQFSIYRDGEVHVLDAECGTCIFRPATRPVEGSRVAEMVRATKDEPGSTVVCHSTLYRADDVKHAVCRGWFDRLGERDPIIQLAVAMDVIVYDPVPAHH